MRLENKVAIVTGGGHGIGRVYCLGLAKEGAKVVVADIDIAGAQETKKLVEQEGGNALAVQVDVANEQSTLAMAMAAVTAYGKIDILVNNAAVFATIPISRVSFDKVPVEEWDRVMNVNLKGMWLCARAVAPSMMAQKYGKIVNISSSSIFAGRGMRIHYTTSKAGVLGFTRTLAMRQKAAERRSLKKIQFPEDLVGAVVFLCSSDSDFMTGQTMIVDGGEAML